MARPFPGAAGRVASMTAMDDLASRLDPLRVSEELGRRGARAAGAEPLLLCRAWPGREGGMAALYAEPGAGEGPPWWSVHLIPSREPGGRLRARYTRALQEGSAIHLGEIEGIAQRFPSDLRMRRLAEALDPKTVSRRLAPCAGAVPRAYKPARRCVIRYEIHDGGATRKAWWGKLYRRGRDAMVQSLHDALARPIAPGGRPGGVPLDPPARRFPRWSMLLWREIEGDLLGSLPAARAALAASATGRALASLHRAPVAWRGAHDPEAELAVLSRWVRAAAAWNGRRAGALLAAEEAIRRLAAPAAAGSMRPAHRDFHENQVLVSGGRISLLDLDTACLAEPELDVGNFLAHLRIRDFGAAGGSTAEPAGAFLDSYRSAGPRLSDRRIDWYRAAALLRLSCVHSFRPHPKDLGGFLLERAAEATGVARQQVMT